MTTKNLGPPGVSGGWGLGHNGFCLCKDEGRKDLSAKSDTSL